MPMSALRGVVAAAWGAMTLKEEVFRSAAELPGAFRRGLGFVIAIGLIVAVASVVGAALGWWTAPDPAALGTAIESGLSDLPFLDQMPASDRAAAQEQMTQVFDAVWPLASRLFPNVGAALIGVIARPLCLVIAWLVVGLVAHVFARLLGGSASLSQTYGATALATSPQLLACVHVLPNVQTAGLTIWSIVCLFVALKSSHGLDPGRSFWATFLTAAGIGVAALVIAAIGLAALVAALVAARGIGA
jgi:hypothetical protein